MLSLTDQLGNTIVLKKPPQRIISLVPSQTELLHDLGLNDEVIGITKFCIHPNHWFRTKQRIGGTKTVDILKVKALKPDLIIANKEENVQQQIEALQQIAPVWLSDVSSLDEALDMINRVGQLVNREREATIISEQIKTSFSLLSNQPSSTDQPPTPNEQPSSDQPSTPNDQPLRTAYFIWRNPYMAAGGDTFINDMLTRCGFINILKNQPRYPEITIDQLSSLNCQLLLLSSEPYPFKQKHIEEMQVQLPNTKIILVNGEMFSWYGSRLQYAVEYFRQLQKEIGANKLN